MRAGCYLLARTLISGIGHAEGLGIAGIDLPRNPAYYPEITQDMKKAT